MKLFILAGLASIASASLPIVQTCYGPVEGLQDDNVYSFKGIPYATAPVGDLRWRSPTAPSESKAPLNATAYGFSCLSFDPAIPNPGASEDCLFLNVWTSSTSGSLPVMVFIHGGGFEFGSGASPTYDGTQFAKQGVVLVTINYRLGIFGFLALPELDEEAPSGNFGLQDQLFALKWVRQNIKAFGGDPNNILAFGQSAGAHAIGMLMTSPLAEGTFDKAIIESGAWWDSEHGSLNTHDQACQIGINWAKGMSLSQLRQLSTQAVVNSSLWNPNTDPTLTAFSPSLDGYVLKSAPAAVFKAGEQLKIPLIAGWNQLEEALFLTRALPHNTAEEFQAGLIQLFGVVPALYPANNQSQTNASSNALTGDLIIREQTWEAGDLHALAGNLVYEYYFTYTSAYSPVPAHTAELPFVFGTLTNGGLTAMTPEANDMDRAFAAQVMSYWVNFAKTGNPNDGEAPQWPQYSPGGQVNELGDSIGATNYDFARFRFIQGYRGSDGRLPASWRTVNA